jgi:uncharacterized protein YbjT (DUF2867 family)
VARVLVVGATGQLGTAVLLQLVASGHSVRAFVRPTSPRGAIDGSGAQLAFGDLRDAGSLEAACGGIETVVATANVVVPRGPGSFEETEEGGYRNLIEACRGANVRRVIFMSVPVTPHDAAVETFRIKRRIEDELQRSGIPSTIFRGSLFMDDWFALMGSSIPLRGAEAHTLRRPFWFSRAFLALVGQLIEKRGLALVPGSGRARHAFIALDDVAAFLAGAVDLSGTESTIHEIGGPEVLSWDEVVGVFARVLGRPIRALHTPAGFYRAVSMLLDPFSPAAANLMAMSRVCAVTDTPYATGELAPLFGITLTSAEQFLRRKLALPDAD